MKTLLSVRLAGPLFARRLSRAAATMFRIAAVCAGLLCVESSKASDPVGVFAIVDKVVVEPANGEPETIQIWGTFVIAEGERGNNYRSPEKGYLYFKLPEKKAEVAQKEWADLKAMAGKNEVVGFSSRYGAPAKVRKADEKAEKPDEFRTGFGLVKMSSRSATYGPVKALLEAVGTKASKSDKAS